jgi:hypothetical protein
MKRTITGGPSSLGALAGLGLFLFLKKFIKGTDNKFFEKKNKMVTRRLLRQMTCHL